MAPNGMAAGGIPACFYCDVAITDAATAVLGPMLDAHGKTCCPDCWAASSLYDQVGSVTL